MTSLWGEEFTIEKEPSQIKAIKKKIDKPLTATKASVANIKNASLFDKLKVVNEKVRDKLSVYKDKTVVLKSVEELNDYVSSGISNCIIAIDTETNKSLDPLTCKIVGLCLYTPGRKNAYIPINHRNPMTKERLAWQVTEEDVKDALSRLGNTKTIMHNGKFDYQVLKCTCGIKTTIYWDSMIAAKLLDENEYSAGLKQQYIDKIDPTIEKYSIDELFSLVDYEDVDPETFALYAATDPYMTYKLYEWQWEKFNKPENKSLLPVMFDIEMPIVEVSAEMELAGISLDLDYQNKLSLKYHKKLDGINKKLEDLLNSYSKDIAEWRKTPEANYKPLTKAGKQGKSKNEQLAEPISYTSSTQLAILLYDVLKYPVLDSRNPRTTDKKALKAFNTDLTKLILEQRLYDKLTKDFIDSLPNQLNSKTGKIHTHFNQMGGEDDTVRTGRFSCSKPNLQQIPSKDASVRLVFRASPSEYSTCELQSNTLKVHKSSEIPTLNSEYKQANMFIVGDVIKVDDDDMTTYETITNMQVDGDYLIFQLTA